MHTVGRKADGEQWKEGCLSSLELDNELLFIPVPPGSATDLKLLHNKGSWHWLGGVSGQKTPKNLENPQTE